MTNQNPIETSAGTYLVTGANGSNGKELIELFVAQQVPVRAMVRSRAKAKEIELPGVEIVEGDFDKPETLRAALAGVKSAFLLTPSSERAQQQQIGFVALAKESGVRRIVNLSQLHAAADSPNRFLRYHAAVEAAIKAAGLEYTFLRPNLFMQALLNFKSTIAEKGEFYGAAGEGRVSIVDVRDIVEIAFAALTQPGHVGKHYDITGPEALTHAEMAAQLSEALGRSIRYVDVPGAALKEMVLGVGFPLWQADGLVEEYALYSEGEAAEVGSGVSEALGREARSFKDFARDYAGAFS
ncbi:SDR family oxidoreductase [bacterium]|nr:MAG: SDR family oxidoreductase [bacterium]